MLWGTLLIPVLAFAAVDAGKGGVTTSANPTLAWREWPMEAQSLRFFNEQIAPLCLSTARSRVSSVKKSAKVLETRSCGEQLQNLAQNLEKAVAQKESRVVHVVRAPEVFWAPMAALAAKKAQTFRPEEIVFDPPTTACGCLVFSGKASDEVRKTLDTRMLQMTGSSVQGRRIVLPLQSK